MPESSNSPLIRCFLLKVASRCNINCDYCYMYNHLDQGWKLQPKLMSDATLLLAAERIRDYVLEHGLDRIAIVYHGGEPLLLGTKKLIAHAEFLKKLLPETEIEFSLQTNGVLIKEADILNFKASNIQISLSIDGPESANDRHRLDHQGRSSYDATANAMAILERYPEVFSGVIAVIDAQNDPREILNFFAEKNIPQLDFLLPDANYITPPIGRDGDSKIYLDWLERCFDIWFDNYPNMKIRTFDSILAGLMGVPSETDGFGFGDVSLITIETDGSYHDLDVLKITGTGTHLSNGGVHNDPINRAINSTQIQRHRELLKKEGLCEKCQSCNVVDICGGGAVAHRYSEDGYLNPSIYCLELKGLIEHAYQRVSQELNVEIEQNSGNNTAVNEVNIENYERVLDDTVQQVYKLFEGTQIEKLRRVINNIYGIQYKEFINALLELKEEQLCRLAAQPSVVAWTEVMLKDMSGIRVLNIDGKAIKANPDYVCELLKLHNTTQIWPKVHRYDYWLRAPFADKIYFENEDIAEKGNLVLAEATRLIKNWNPVLLEEMRLISPEIQYIKDPSAHPEKVVSFSDNSVPGALYVQLMRGNEQIEASDLADSIIHEHRHQKLYMLQRIRPIVNADYPLVASPWREELRPPTGLFHALYVFVELLDFWDFYRDTQELGEKAIRECSRIKSQLESGFKVVETCDLTADGRTMLNLLYKKYSKLNHEDKAALSSIT